MTLIPMNYIRVTTDLDYKISSTSIGKAVQDILIVKTNEFLNFEFYFIFLNSRAEVSQLV